MADVDQLRTFVKENSQDSSYYTASLSPYLQGVELVQFYQLANYVGVKARSNTSPVIALSGSSQGWQSTGESFQFFNDQFSPENRGLLITKSVPAYSIGRDSSLGQTGQTTYITFVTSGSSGFVPSGSIKSQANLDTKNRFDTYISHYAEKRDLGQTNTYDDGLPFEEAETIEKGFTASQILGVIPENLKVSTNLVQVCSSPASFDGVIEAQDIRRIADRTSIDMPFIIRSPKGALCVVDDNMKSYQFSDEFDIRQIESGMSTAPYLDYVSVFGTGQALMDQPGAFSDAPEHLSAFTDSSRIASAYPSGSIDAEMLSLILSGVTSGSVQMLAPDTNYFPTYLVAARHGFVFSQNDNYGYDSIAFGGLKK